MLGVCDGLLVCSSSNLINIPEQLSNSCKYGEILAGLVISDDDHWLPIKSEEQGNKRVHMCPWLLADDIRIQNLKLLRCGANHLSLTPDLLNKCNFSLVVYGHCYGS